MTNGNQKLTYDDGVDIKDLFDAKCENILSLINANDKNYNQRFENVIQATQSALSAADRAVNKAESATERRFESVNEFRQTLSDQAAKFIIRSEFDLVVDRLEQDIKNLMITRGEMVATKTYDAAHSDLQKQVDELRLSRATLEGKASQESVNQVSTRALLSMILAVIGTVISVVGFIVGFVTY